MYRIGVINGKIKYVSLVYRATLAKFQPHGRKLSVYEVTEEVAQDMNDIAPSSIGPVMQTTESEWGWMDVERLMVETFFTGLMLCFPMSYIILLVASQNFIVSTTAIITIMCIVANVMGFFKYYFNWALDF